MTATVVQHGRNSFVAALEWRTVADSSNESAEISAYAKELGASQMVRIEADGAVAVGFALAQRAKGYSLAAAFALTPSIDPFALLYYDTGDGVAVVGLRHGLPQPGFDRVGGADDMAMLAEDFLGLCPNGCTIYSNTRRFAKAQQIGVEELEHSRLSDAKLKQVRHGFGRVFVLLAVLGVVAAVMAGYFYFDAMSKEEARKKAATKQQQDPNLLYQQMLPAALANAGRPASVVVGAVRHAVSSVPTAVSGWSLSTIECSAESCAVTWKRLPESGATFEGFAAEAPKMSPLFMVDALTLKTSIDLSLAETQSGVSRETLPGLQDFLQRTGSQYQSRSPAGWKFAFTEPAVFGAPPGVDAKQIKNPVLSGRWQAGGEMWMLEGLLDAPANMLLDSLVIKFDGLSQLSFSAEGKFYVH